MTETEDPAAPPARSIPDLLTGTALVALVPATADLDAAAVMAWSLARGAAASRRVALVDCHVDEPQLHAAAGTDNRDGIVDVFEYGASLSRIAQQQPQPNLYFVPAGTFAPDPAVMAAHPRWRRLSAGFRHEDAVMLLFLPADCIGTLASVLDGIVALTPDGAEAGLASTPEIQAAVDAGVPLLAALTDTDDLALLAEPEAEVGEPEAAVAQPVAAVEAAPPEPAVEAAHAEPAVEAAEPEPVVDLPPPEPAIEAAAPALEVIEPAPEAAESAAALERAPEAAEPAPETEAEPALDLEPEAEVREMLIWRARRGPPAAWGGRAALYGGVALLAAAVLAVAYRRELGLGDLGVAALRSDAEPAPEPMTIVPGYRILAPRAVDTLPFGVQVSAWTSLVFALDAGDALEEHGIPPMIAPIRLGSRLWYRVYAGPVATQDAADSLLGALRGAGLDRARAAVAVLVPLSLALRRVATAVAARAERLRLRALGIPAFVLGQADGTYRLYAGAYGASEQAGYLDSLTTSTGSAGQLGPRVGFHP